MAGTNLTITTPASSTVITAQVPSSPQVIQIQLPGTQGPAGQASSLTIGTVTTGAAGSNATATLTGSAPSQTLNLTIPRGATGSTGPSNTLTIGTVTTGAPGSSATATISGTAPNQTLNLTIPQGAQGPTGSGATDATTTAKGSIQLAGDLAGTAAAPTVPGLAGKANTSHTHSVTDLTATGTKSSATFLRGDNTWATPAGAVTDATTTVKGIVQLAGDLAGTAAAPTVPGLTGKAPTTRLISAGTGLSGGGDLSADRTLAVSYGSAAGTAVQGNDIRVTADQIATQASIRTIGTGALQAAAGNHTHTATADASTTVKGIVQLTNALGGTATLPTALGLDSQASLTEFIQDTVATELVGGSNITVSYDDPSGKITIDASASGLTSVGYADLPPGSAIIWEKSPTTGWPLRPTSRSDIKVIWKGADPDPTIVASGTGGMLPGDTRFVTP